MSLPVVNLATQVNYEQEKGECGGLDYSACTY